MRERMEVSMKERKLGDRGIKDGGKYGMKGWREVCRKGWRKE
jgi:hypothetical protein